MNKLIERNFKGRNLLIATMHGKEKIIKDLLEQSLGVRVITAEGFDTDDFGTFSGEVERELSPLETARAKCMAAAQLTGESLVLASEGFFGAHPVMSFVPADEELLVLRDFEHGHEYKSRVVSTRTNFAGNEYYDIEDAMFFAAQVGFPSHGVIVRNGKHDLAEMHKGINTWQKLKESLRYFKSQYGKLYIETDMRAHLNPTRARVIREAADKLIEAIYQTRYSATSLTLDE